MSLYEWCLKKRRRYDRALERAAHVDGGRIYCGREVVVRLDESSMRVRGIPRRSRPRLLLLFISRKLVRTLRL